MRPLGSDYPAASAGVDHPRLGAAPRPSAGPGRGDPLHPAFSPVKPARYARTASGGFGLDRRASGRVVSPRTVVLPSGGPAKGVAPYQR